MRHLTGSSMRLTLVLLLAACGGDSTPQGPDVYVPGEVVGDHVPGGPSPDVYNPTPDAPPEATLAGPFPKGTPPMPIPADNPLSEDGIQLGRRLFYDPILAADGARTCSFCHKQQFAFGDAVPVIDSRRPNSRNTMPLFNLGWRKRFFWDERGASVEVAALDALKNELEPDTAALLARIAAHPDYPARFAAAFPDDGGAITEANVGRALAQFLRTLVSLDAPMDHVERGTYTMTEEEAAGEALMKVSFPRGGPGGAPEVCVQCHMQERPSVEGRETAGLYAQTTPRSNGLTVDTSVEGVDRGVGGVTGRAEDMDRFLVPTLRNLKYTAPYMHDGRFATLEDVLRHYGEHIDANPNLDPVLQYDGQPLKLSFTEEEITQIAAMLRLFSDDAFVRDPRFGNPFLE